jgi:NAD(P)-dependent dehydrogenase (short-subunit alcohol dehydrogenase family)
MPRIPKRDRTPRTTIAGATALVTGAGSGIGRATALALAERGATVLCVDLDLATAQKTAAACEEAGAPAASAHGVDVSDRAALERLAADVERDHGALHILVNNAGVGMTGRFLDMSERDWTWIRGVNLDGVVNGCAAFAPAMVEAGRGHVVNVSSGLGYTPTATEPGYVTTKAAVLALSQCLRADWASSGVGVTAICPGVINTPIIDHTRFLGDAGTPERRAKTTKVFRRGHKPEQVAKAIVDAIERDRAIVPVGFEAKAGWYLHRLAPIALQQAVARQGLR